MDPETELPGFPATFSIPVQWGDQDLFGHVNNIIYFRWLESARIAYWINSGLHDAMKDRKLGPILAHTSCDYKLQIKYPDMIRTGARIKKIGDTSVTLEHDIFSQQNRAVAATGISVVVLFDYANQQKVKIGDEFRELIERFEGRSP